MIQKLLNTDHHKFAKIYQDLDVHWNNFSIY